MSGLFSMHRPKYLNLFLNVSFLFLISCLSTHLYSSNSNLLNPFKRPNSIIIIYSQIPDGDIGCKDLHKHHETQAKCTHVKSHSGCQPRGYIPYLQLFYCNFTPPLGYTLLTLWLILLFYLLGDTAAAYFCASLEGLSRILKLSPAIAGATLLSLGNGAPDVFAAVISFTGEYGTKEVGLNGVLGGAFFVSSAVVGIISFSVPHPCRSSINKSSFTRDVVFFLVSLSSLLVITSIGKINLWGAISFLSLYFIYLLFICASQKYREEEDQIEAFPEAPVLPLTTPLLGYRVEEEHKGGGERCLDIGLTFSTSGLFGKLVYILELPLYLPRRLTIPVVSSERWCKPFAVFSVTTSPVILAVIWASQGPKQGLLTYGVGGSVGIFFGFLSFFTTERSNPPRKCLFPWLALGFVMSVTWTYILAKELISVLVSLGLVLGTNPSILGLTVLAWGNSLGDLVSNVTVAKQGGPGGAQVAISGCYAGPMFNIVVGLGLSLVFSAWNVYPSCYVITGDPCVHETVGFMIGGLLWALVIMHRKNMRLDRFLGGGLLAIYLCFLSLKMARTLGLVVDL